MQVSSETPATRAPGSFSFRAWGCSPKYSNIGGRTSAILKMLQDVYVTADGCYKRIRSTVIAPHYRDLQTLRKFCIIEVLDLPFTLASI
jgi:hypothetical protein